MKKYIIILISILFLPFAVQAQPDKLVLLTEEEGAMKEAPSGLIDVGRIFNDGPKIKVITPEMSGEYKAPLKIIVSFISENGKEVDLGKLKVECLKFLTIDITDRIRPYATKEGINIEKADVPRGKHKFRLTIGDIDGGLSQEIFVAKII